MPNQYIKLRVPEGELEYNVRVMDTQGPTAVIRVPDELVDRDDITRVEITFGHRSFFMTGPARVRALYDVWWFLEPPAIDECETIQRRQWVRVAYQDHLVAIHTTALGEPVSEAVQARMVNMSAGGCLLQLPFDLQVGDHVLVVAAFAGLPVNPILSRVMRRDATSENGTWYGIRFETIDDRYQEELAHFIASYIQQKLADGEDVTRLDRPE
jgi:c-di-GMP-binding flagellar brake protein YcgR